MSIFEYLDYRQFLQRQVDENRETRGYLTELAKGAGCQLSAISHVLKSRVELTLDQAAGMASFWKLTENESQYFLELVTFERAGTRKLKELIKKRIDHYRSNDESLTDRLKPKTVLLENAQAAYYSSWHWIAVHLLTGVPGFSSPQSIAQRLGLPIHLVKNTLVALEKLSLVKRDGEKWSILNSDVHLNKDSNFTSVNHMNWRHRAIQSIQSQDQNSLHYTSVLTLSLKDIEITKEKFRKFIQESREIAKNTQEEEMVSLNFDLFRV